MNESIRFVLKPEDAPSSPAPLHAVPDLQALNVALADLLARAETTTATVLELLTSSNDLLAGVKLARVYAAEAHDAIVEAVETREQLGRAQRGAGLFSARYAGVR